MLDASPTEGWVCLAVSRNLSVQRASLSTWLEEVAVLLQRYPS